MLRIWLLNFMLLFCHPVWAEEEIANGKIISENEFPEVVKIYATFGNQGASCTATIVGHNSLLTAAHCLYFFGPKAETVEIVTGKYEGVQSLDCFIHPRFPLGTGYYDIALVKFADNSFETEIPLADEIPETGQEFTIVGYGKFSFYSNISDGKKRMGTNRLSKVGRRLDFVGVHKNQGPGDQGTGKNVANLPGDSGGPMLVNGRVIGVSASIDSKLNDQSQIVGHYEHVLYDENLEFLKNSSIRENIHLSGLELEVRTKENEQKRQAQWEL